MGTGAATKGRKPSLSTIRALPLILLVGFTMQLSAQVKVVDEPTVAETCSVARPEPTKTRYVVADP
jgi:hypothetical protein